MVSSSPFRLIQSNTLYPNSYRSNALSKEVHFAYGDFNSPPFSCNYLWQRTYSKTLPSGQLRQQQPMKPVTSRKKIVLLQLLGLRSYLSHVTVIVSSSMTLLQWWSWWVPLNEHEQRQWWRWCGCWAPCCWPPCPSPWGTGTGCSSPPFYPSLCVLDTGGENRCVV